MQRARWISLNVVGLLCLLASPALAEQGYLYLATLPSSLGPIGHSVAGVKADRGQPLFIHQVGNAGGRIRNVVRGGFPTSIVEARGHPGREGYATLRLPITAEQARRGATRARELTSTRDGKYHVLNNSCATVAGQVLEAAGHKPPWWARSPRLLERWFRHRGAQRLDRPTARPSRSRWRARRRTGNR